MTITFCIKTILYGNSSAANEKTKKREREREIEFLILTPRVS